MDNSKVKTGLELIIPISEEHVLFSLKKGSFFVAGFNSFHSVLYRTDAPHDAEFNFVVTSDTARQISKLVSKKGNISFEQVQDKVTVTSGKTILKIATEKESKVKTAANILRTTDETDFDLTVNGEIFTSAINKVRHFSGDKKIADFRFHGFHFTIAPDRLELMTTNKKAMAITSFPNSLYISTFESVVLLNENFHQLSKIMDGEVKLKFSEASLYIECSSTEYSVKLLTSLIQATPLDYTSLIADLGTPEHTITFDRKELQEAGRSGDYFSDEKLRHRMDISIKDKHATLETSSAKGRYASELDIDYTGVTTFALPSEQLNLAISASSSDTVLLYVYDERKRVVVDDGLTKTLISQLKNT